MAIHREYHVPLKNLSTFRMGGEAEEMVSLDTEEDLEELFATLPLGRKWFIVGGGSNIVFPDGDCETLLIRFNPRAVTLQETNDAVLLKAPGGAVWDDVVAFAVSNGLSGLEALSAIPGTVGATPIQNVGAYGTETSDVLENVRAFDTESKKFVFFSNEGCRFGYRDSIFKHSGRKYIITEVVYALSRELPDVPQYPGIAEFFAEQNITRATLTDIRNAIIAIRSKKLPNPKEIASVGSFFKNAIVPNAQAEKLKSEFPTLAVFPVSEEFSKVGAGSLIDTLGLKGKKFGNLSIYKNNALVLINEGGATRKELQELIHLIVSQVKEKFGITLEPEPELLDIN